MKNDDHQHSGHFDASMPLPDDVRIKQSPASDDSADDQSSQNPAADLIRQKVDDAYTSAPPADEEVEEVSQLAGPISKHQKFIDELINSGKSLPEIQEAWHEYYAGLTDADKHAVWKEFYAEHDHSAELAGAVIPATHQPAQVPTAPRGRPKKTTARKEYVKRKTEHINRKAAPAVRHIRRGSPLRSLLFGLGIGAVVIVIFLFSFFNERFIAPFIQPSRTVTNTPIISDSAAISSNPEIVIPKINVEIPVVYTVATIDPDAIENALEGGVVHYADTALPGQDGNVVIVGHSSNNIFNQGKYKFAFVLLSRLDTGDTFYLQKDGVRYTYEVYQKQIVSPTDVSVLGPTSKPATATLITCDPPGTSTNRLVVVGQQISPSPNANLAAAPTNDLATKAAIIPGNSPSLWSRLTSWFSS